jgi:hypothetical protein
VQVKVNAMVGSLPEGALAVSGGAVLTALETGVGSYPALEGRFLQVRGGVVGCSQCVVL